MAIIFNGTNVAQDPLVSGTNIKTINSNSLLGSGNISITADVSTAAVGAATTGLTAGAVGSYAMMWKQSLSIINQGGTSAGSSLYFCGHNAYTNGMPYVNFYSQTTVSSASTGTWRCMGRSFGDSAENNYGGVTLWLRIA